MPRLSGMIMFYYVLLVLPQVPIMVSVGPLCFRLGCGRSPGLEDPGRGPGGWVAGSMFLEAFSQCLGVRTWLGLWFFGIFFGYCIFFWTFFWIIFWTFMVCG